MREKFLTADKNETGYRKVMLMVTHSPILLPTLVQKHFLSAELENNNEHKVNVKRVGMCEQKKNLKLNLYYYLSRQTDT